MASQCETREPTRRVCSIAEPGEHTFLQGHQQCTDERGTSIIKKSSGCTPVSK